MKTSIKFLKLTSLVMIAALVLSSCASILSSKKTEVVLVNPPDDLKVTENGVRLNIEQVQAQAKAKGTDVTVIYYASGVYVSKKVKRHTLVLESAGKKGQIELKSKVNGGIVFLDIIFTGGLGCFVDGATKKWRKIKSNHVDVKAVLEGTAPRSQRALRKTIRRQAEGRE